MKAGFFAHVSFAFAKSFYDANTKREVHYPANRLEKLGSSLAKPFNVVVDQSIRQLQNPVMLVGLTALTLLGISFAFYAKTTVEVILNIAPWIHSLSPELVKAGLCFLTMTTTLGLGMQAQGRFNNQELYTQWQQEAILASYLGDIAH